MSVKVMGLVWDMECPSQINGRDFKPNHKYVLIAYSDNADHSGKNIRPAIETVARKTGYFERSVQRLTRDLEDMGLLVYDGKGPHGTNRYYIPLSPAGDKITPLSKQQGDKSEKSLGDNPSGVIPSGDNLPPEFNNINREDLYISKSINELWGDVKKNLQNELPKSPFETWVKDTEAVGVFQDKFLYVSCRNSYAVAWLESRLQDRVDFFSGYFVKFVVLKESEEVEEIVEYQ